MEGKSGTARFRIIALLLPMIALVAASGCTSNAAAQKPKLETISGTGSYSSLVKSTNETLPPAGVIHDVRMVEAAWSGFIVGPAPARVDVLRNPNPPESVFRGVYTFKEAKVGNRSGGLVLEMKGSSQGDVKVAPGTHSVWQITMLSGTGDFEGATGHGLAIGGTHLTTTFLTYWMQFEVPVKSK